MYESRTLYSSNWAFRSDVSLMKDIQQFYRTKIDEMPQNVDELL